MGYSRSLSRGRPCNEPKLSSGFVHTSNAMAVVVTFQCRLGNIHVLKAAASYKTTEQKSLYCPALEEAELSLRLIEFSLTEHWQKLNCPQQGAVRTLAHPIANKKIVLSTVHWRTDADGTRGLFDRKLRGEAPLRTRRGSVTAERNDSPYTRVAMA